MSEIRNVSFVVLVLLRSKLAREASVTETCISLRLPKMMAKIRTATRRREKLAARTKKQYWKSTQQQCFLGGGGGSGGRSCGPLDWGWTLTMADDPTVMDNVSFLLLNDEWYLVKDSEGYYSIYTRVKDIPFCRRW
ncbi:LOW QUALITY PROTEIN: hypothetical protein TorRG33x02_210860 [Trema orientale]|uniref:Uncharacterized protein n=1 Tax=Trema orientale TaxID=63057 RepID=A0A2P5EC39_TREOI|nr:LOW QUALITY PROTEIN: hypothetical protein TorRG33x02_210860 [Trema orientale]